MSAPKPHPLLARMSQQIVEFELAERRAHEDFLATSPADGDEFDAAHTVYQQAHSAADKARKDFHKTWRLINEVDKGDAATRGSGN